MTQSKWNLLELALSQHCPVNGPTVEARRPHTHDPPSLENLPRNGGQFVIDQEETGRRARSDPRCRFAPTELCPRNSSAELPSRVEGFRPHISRRWHSLPPFRPACRAVLLLR